MWVKPGAGFSMHSRFIEIRRIPEIPQRSDMEETIGRGVASALAETEREVLRLLELFPAAILLCRGNCVSMANAKAAALFHLPPGQRLEGRLLAGLVERRDATLQGCILHRLDGTRCVVDLTESGEADTETILILQPQRADRAVLGSSPLAETIFKATDEAMLITDADQIILSVNPAFERVTGYSAAEAVGQTPKLLSSGRHDMSFYSEMWKTLLEGGHWHGEIWNRRKNGELYFQRITLSVLRDDGGDILNYVAVFSDITDSKREADRLHHLVSHDSLTRLPNRTLLQDRLEQALAQASRKSTPAALMFIDLDGFKQVNDRLGHLIGDRLLEAVADRLNGCVRESDTVARVGGDEFVILLPEVKSSGDARKLAAKLLSKLSAPFMFAEGTASIGASIGIALYPRDGESGEALLSAADEAMYQAKRKGGRRALCVSDL